MSALARQLVAIASSPVLLIGSDFDGTIAPIVERPDLAEVDRRAWEALRALATLPHTHSVVITGRARADALSRLPDAGRVTVVGSHGLETSASPLRLSPDAAQRLRSIQDLLYAEALELTGSLVECKPISVAFHVRRCESAAGDAALDRLRRYARSMDGVHTIDGLRVLELAVLEPGKGRALARVRHDTGATAVLFIGDDATDEHAFRELRAPDLSIKIGPGPTAAMLRVDSQADVARVFEDLLRYRRAVLASRVLTPIERHSVLSDQRAAALVDDRGNMVWASLPRIDSPPIFARLLGDAEAGEFSIEPVGALAAVPPAQHYDGDSFVLNTRWTSPELGSLTVTDYFDSSGGRPFQRAGRTELTRVIESVGEAKTVRIRFAPRLDFGRLATRLRAHPDGLEIEGWIDPIVLRAPGIPWRIIDSQSQGTPGYAGPSKAAPGHQSAIAEFVLRGSATLELRYGTASLRPSDAKFNESTRREQTRRFWSGWTATLRPVEPHSALVRRSALVIKALCHGPTGAIAAAATTSLPEHLGGVRNWDYRYCWIRDACMSASAIARLGGTGVGLRLLDWLVQVVGKTESPERLRPLYTVSGELLGPEAEIGELAGYGGSRPVRIGNAASHQVQLDVFGPVVELVAVLAEAGAPVTPEQWRLVQDMVRAVELRWTEPDHGIWEIRGPKRHHVHTKAMCFMAVDRAIYVAEHAMGMKRPGWEALREQIRADVLARGLYPSAPHPYFTAAYGEAVLDASTLLVGMCGLIEPADPRFVATVEAVQRGLQEGPVVARYRADDGLPGREGAWIICAAWLVEALVMIGRREEGADLLSRIAALAGPTGLFAEEYDADLGIALGNFPQAYSHLGFINAAVRLEQGGKGG